MKKLNKSSLLIIIGLIVSITAMETVSTELFDSPQTETINHGDDEGSGDSVVAKSVKALPFLLEFQIDPELFLLNVLPENEEEELPGSIFSDILDAQQKVLKVLFRQIISPNAP